jgi:acetyl-CoA C-acetyltransferase
MGQVSRRARAGTGQVSHAGGRAPHTIGAVREQVARQVSRRSLRRRLAGGDADGIVVGGMEGMSNCPYLLDKARTAISSETAAHDSMVLDGLRDLTATSHKYWPKATPNSTSPEDQDRFAYESQMKVGNAIKTGSQQEIVPVEIPQKKGDLM